jgi:acyl carrier protein
MSLDSLELLMEVENTFGIQIPDLEAEEIGTVGDFYQCVLSKLEILPIEGCRSQKLFYRFRRILADKYKISLKSITTTTPLENIIPKKNRKQAWRELEKRFVLKLPDLDRPYWIEKLISFSIKMVFIVAFVACFWLKEYFTNAVFILPFVFYVFCNAFILWMTESLALEFKVNTFKDLIHCVTIQNFNKLNLSIHHKEDILSILIGVISEKCGLDPHEIKLTSHISNDLGID